MRGCVKTKTYEPGEEGLRLYYDQVIEIGAEYELQGKIVVT